MPVNLTARQFKAMIDREAPARKGKKPKAELKPLPPIEDFIAETNQLAFIRDGWTRVCLPYPPGDNHLYAVVRGRKILSKRGRIYRKFCADIAAIIGLRPITGDVQVMVDLYRPQRSGDLFNFTKAALDSMKGFMWHDDGQICGGLPQRYEDRHFPRCVISVRLTAGQTLNMEFPK